MPEKNGTADKSAKVTNGYCACPNCTMFMGMGHKHFLLRWLLGILLLLIVFWLGLQIGEFKSSIGSGFGSGGYGYHRNMFPPRYPVMMPQSTMPMNNSSGSGSSSSSTSTTPSTLK